MRRAACCIMGVLTFAGPTHARRKEAPESEVEEQMKPISPKISSSLSFARPPTAFGLAGGGGGRLPVEAGGGGRLPVEAGVNRDAGHGIVLDHWAEFNGHKMPAAYV